LVPMSTSAHFKLSDFPHKVLDPIATLTVPPTYATIKRAQRQLMTNAAAIPTLNGGGAHGHMALTLTALAYADISDVPFVIPVAPLDQIRHHQARRAPEKFPVHVHPLEHNRAARIRFSSARRGHRFLH
jgi:hypothetical protein